MRHRVTVARGTHEGEPVLKLRKHGDKRNRQIIAMLTPDEFYQLTNHGVDLCEQIEREQKEGAHASNHRR